MPQMNPQMFRQSLQMMKNMPDSQMNQFTQQAMEMQRNGKLPFGNMNPNMMNKGFAPPPTTPSTNAIHPFLEKYKEDVEIVTNFKEIGNKMFKKEKFDKAEEYFKKVLDYDKNAIKEIHEIKNDHRDEDFSPLNEIEMKLNQNLALVKMKEEDWEAGLKYANASLDLGEKSSKGWYRKGVCLKEIGNLEAALMSIEKAKKYGRNDQAINDLYKQLHKDLGREYVQETEGKMEEKPSQNTEANPVQGMMQSEAGKSMMKQMYKQQFGMDLSDEQLKSMQGMMNPEMMKQGAEMLKNNPGLAQGNGNMMAEMMKTDHGRKMIKENYKARMGMDLSDAQLDMMSSKKFF
jgi:tetratricopeptide (TPR) repeat protein